MGDPWVGGGEGVRRKVVGKGRVVVGTYACVRVELDGFGSHCEGA